MLAAAFAYLAAAFAPVGASLVAYAAKYGISIAVKAAPALVAGLTAVLLYSTGGFFVRAGVVALAASAFALGVEARAAVDSKC